MIAAARIGTEFKMSPILILRSPRVEYALLHAAYNVVQADRKRANEKKE